MGNIVELPKDIINSAVKLGNASVKLADGTVKLVEVLNDTVNDSVLFVDQKKNILYKSNVTIHLLPHVSVKK